LDGLRQSAFDLISDGQSAFDNEFKFQTDVLAGGAMLINFDDTIVQKNQSRVHTAAKLLSRLNCSNIKPPESRQLICLHLTALLHAPPSTCTPLGEAAKFGKQKQKQEQFHGKK
jgi:hypothetical protein